MRLQIILREHLPVDCLIRNFDNGRVNYIANSVEQALLLPRDMAELRNLKKHEMFLSLKRDLPLAHFLPSSFITVTLLLLLYMSTL